MTADDPAQRRFPRRVYRVGVEPDPRFTLANERTFLAWIRSALALIAAGVALEAFSLPILPALRLSATLILILLGIAAALYAWIGWMTVERAIRGGRPLPSPVLAGPVGLGVAVVGILIALGLFLS